MDLKPLIGLEDIENKMMETYYLGGYYLMNGPTPWGKVGNKSIPTCGCINYNLYGAWCFDFADSSAVNQGREEAKQNFQLSDQAIKSIQNWVSEKFNEIGWGECFPTLDLVKEYQALFFSHLHNLAIYAVYFPESDVEYFKTDFEGHNFSLLRNVLKYSPENYSLKEKLMGFDFLYIVGGFGDAHSMYCADGIGGEKGVNALREQFKATINNNGLFEEQEDWGPIRAYINSPNHCNEGPIYIAKIKLCEQ